MEVLRYIALHALVRRSIWNFGNSVPPCSVDFPQRSFLAVDDFANISELANRLVSLSKKPSSYWLYHEWRRRWKVIDAFSFPEYHFCLLCRRLHQEAPSATSVVVDPEAWWYKNDTVCEPAFASKFS